MRPIVLLVSLALLVMAGACSGGDKDSFRNVDHDKNGKISYEELLFVFPEVTRETFAALDKNGDNMLSEDEYAQFLKQNALAAKAKKTPPAAAPQTKPAAVQSGPTPTNQPAVPYKDEEVIEITSPEAKTGTAAKAKPEHGRKDRKNKTDDPHKGEATQYTVMHGDNLTKIAHRFGLSVEDITRANGNMAPDTLRDGQVLTIPARP